MGWVTKTTAIKNRTGYFYEGKEIALIKLVGEKQKKPRHNTHWWPEKNKIEAATLWAVMKDIEKVHQITTIPRWAIRRWMKEPWWDNVVNNVRKEQNELLDAKLTGVIHKAVELIEDRLVNGEVKLDQKTKETYREPVNVRTATHAVEVTFKQRQLLRGEATQVVSGETTDSKLQKLKDQFEKLAKSKKINTLEPLEGDYVSVQGTGEGEAVETETFSEGEEPQEWEISEGAGDEEVTEETIEEESESISWQQFQQR